MKRRAPQPGRPVALSEAERAHLTVLYQEGRAGGESEEARYLAYLMELIEERHEAGATSEDDPLYAAVWRARERVRVGFGWPSAEEDVRLLVAGK